MFRKVCAMVVMASMSTGACMDPLEVTFEEEPEANVDQSVSTAGSSKIPTKTECKAVLDYYGAAFQFEDHPSVPQAVRLFTLSHSVTAVYAVADNNGYQETSGTGDLLTSCAVATALVSTVHDLWTKGVILTQLIHGGSYQAGNTVPGTAVLSEHANGTAVDIVGIKNGPTTWTVKNQYESGQIETLRASLNTFFEVVLDKDNSGVSHKDHFHAARPISALLYSPLGSEQQPQQQEETPKPSGSAPKEKAKLKLCEPFNPAKSVFCKFGDSCYTGHKGNDYAAAKDTLVYAPASGTVTGLDKSVTGQVCTKNANGFYSPGNFVKISQGDYDVQLFHLTQGIPSAVQLNSQIKAGTPAGYVSNTGYTETLNKEGFYQCGIGSGYHLHLQVSKKDASGTYIAFDPYGSTDVEWVSCTYNNLGIAGFKDEEDDEPPQNGSPQDYDGDGFADDTDCDDGDPSVFPNAKEYCNGIDDNCDGKTDENFPAVGTWCYDGYGACKVTGTYICASNGTSQICSATTKAPKPEICGNSTDDDCDDEIDEGCGSVPPVSSSNELEITVKADKTLPAIDFSFCYDPGITNPQYCYQWNQSVKTVVSNTSITWKMDVSGGAIRFNSTLFKDTSDVQGGTTVPWSGDAWLCEGTGANAHLTLPVTATLGGKDISAYVTPVSYDSSCSAGISLNGL